MTLGRIVLKSLRQHALSTAVTSISIALAGGLLMAVWSVKEQAQATFTRIDFAQGRTSSYVMSDIGATSPGRWQPTQLL